MKEKIKIDGKYFIRVHIKPQTKKNAEKSAKIHRIEGHAKARVLHRKDGYYTYISYK